MKAIIKKLLNIFSDDTKKNILHFLRIVFYKKYRWNALVYWKHGQKNRQKLFLDIARFLNINRPINGYYFEFGCNEANTFRMAYNTFKNLFDFEYVAFDSFEGLPEIEQKDKMEIFYKGKLAFDVNRFKSLVLKEGISEKKLKIVKGFYSDTLNPDLVKKLSPKKAALIYVDCDLYTSTVDVLNFIKYFLQPGTVIVFDDWNCFYGDSNRGQKKAFSEFLQKNKNLQFEEFLNDAESRSYIFTKHKL